MTKKMVYWSVMEEIRKRIDELKEKLLRLQEYL